MGDWLTADFFSIIVAAFLVGTIVGLTGMGGGALMTPALIFLGVGGASTVVTADLTAAAIYKSGWAPLGAGKDDTHPVVVALVGLAMVVLVPLVWGLIRRTEGMPMFGAPTVAELEAGDQSLPRTPSAAAEDETQVP